MRRGLFNPTLRIVHGIIAVLFIPSLIHAQLSIVSAIDLSHEQQQQILSLLEVRHEHSGICSNLSICKAYLATFEEKADYGPMWYGDTIVVNQSGVLIAYEFNKVDTIADKNKTSYHSNDWHSSERMFIPNDHSAIYTMYTCRFGGIPPSHGFAHRRKEWNPKIETVLEILKIN